MDRIAGRSLIADGSEENDTGNSERIKQLCDRARNHEAVNSQTECRSSLGPHTTFF